RNAEVEGVRQEFLEAEKVRKDQRLADAHQGLKEGEDLLQEEDFANAERKFRRVYEELLWFDYPVDVTGLRQQAKDGIDRTLAAKRKHDETARAGVETVVKGQRQKELEEENRIRDQ